GATSRVSAAVHAGGTGAPERDPHRSEPRHCARPPRVPPRRREAPGHQSRQAGEGRGQEVLAVPHAGGGLESAPGRVISISLHLGPGAESSPRALPHAPKKSKGQTF